MPLVYVEALDLVVPQFAQNTFAANSEDNLLAKTVALVAAVERIGQSAANTA